MSNTSDRQQPILNDSLLNITQANPGDNPAFDLIGLTQLRNEPQYDGIDGSGFSVAVIDTGIDLTHPLIAPNYVTGYDFVDNDSDPSDPQEHGTHVSGIVGARDETIGVAPDVGLIGLRVAGSDGGAFITDLEAALAWVLENQEQYNITAVNLSLGGGFFTNETEVQGSILNILVDDIQRLEAAGVTVVAAAGNGYFTNSEQPNQANIAAPAIFSTIAVGAVWQDNITRNISWQSGGIDFSTGTDRITSFSQRLVAPNLVFAPGAIISSTLPGGEIGGRAGTSQAAPHVAGSVALLQEASLQFGGRLLTTDEVTEILFTTGDVIIDGDDEDDNVNNTNSSYIRINLYNAVEEVRRRYDDIISSPENSSQVYRFFRSDIGVHFYTASRAERNNIIGNLPNYIYEGESYQSATDPLTGASSPVYRFLNTTTGTHFYTISETERDNITNNLPNYNLEGIAYYGYTSDRPGATPLYRFYNPVTDSHFYTPSAVERDAVLANLPDYQLEGQDGIAFYVEPII